MTGANFLGMIMILGMFVLFFLLIVVMEGLIVALIIFGVTAFIVFWIGLAVHLIVND